MEILAIIAAALGVFFVLERGKRKSAEALLENQDTKKKVAEVDKDVNKNLGLLQAEVLKRLSSEEDLKKEEQKDVSKEMLIDFFNSRNDDDSKNKPS
jgi:hypothetical protein